METFVFGCIYVAAFIYASLCLACKLASCCVGSFDRLEVLLVFHNIDTFPNTRWLNPIPRGMAPFLSILSLAIHNTRILGWLWVTCLKMIVTLFAIKNDRRFPWWCYKPLEYSQSNLHAFIMHATQTVNVFDKLQIQSVTWCFQKPTMNVNSHVHFILDVGLQYISLGTM